MSCQLVNTDLPIHLTKILKDIEVGNDFNLKECACKLKYYEQREDSDFGYYATALPWCMPTLEQVNAAIAEATADWEGTFTFEIFDEHEVDLKHISETFYAKKFEFKGVITSIVNGCVNGNNPTNSLMIKLATGFDDLLAGIDIKKSVCDERFTTSQFYANSFVRGKDTPLWQIITNFYGFEIFGFNTKKIKYCSICPSCQNLVQEGLLDPGACDPDNCMGFPIVNLHTFANIYKYDEGQDCEKGRYKYKQFGIKITNNDDTPNTLFTPYISKFKIDNEESTLRGYGQHFGGGPNYTPNYSLAPEIKVTTNS